MARAQLGTCDNRHVFLVRPKLKVIQIPVGNVNSCSFIFDQLCVKMLNEESISDFSRNFHRHVLCTPLIYPMQFTS